MAIANTKEAESAQALFCAAADYLGSSKINEFFDLDKYKSYTSFKMSWDTKYPSITLQKLYNNHVEADASFISVERLLSTDEGWYRSSILIAKKLLLDINKISSKFAKITRPNLSEIYYVRGDKSIMDNINELFTRANNTQKKILSAGSNSYIAFSNINKWSPADIYFASTTARTKISKEVDSNNEITFSYLNSLIAEMIDQGELLPLSLKKQTKEVHIEKVNFNKKEELQKIKKITFNGINNWSMFSEKDKKNIGQRGFARHLEIYMDPVKRMKIIVRHDPAGDSGGVVKADILIPGMEARSGGLGTGPMIGLLRLIDTSFSSKYELIIKNATRQFKLDKMKYRELLRKGSMKRDEFDKEVAYLSATIVTNTILPSLITWLKTKNNGSDFCKLCFQYATSRSSNSSMFVVAK